MKRHLYIFLEGLVVVAPVAITVYVIYGCVSWLDGKTRILFGDLIPGFPGLGFLSMLILIYLIGLTVKYLFMNIFVGLLNSLLGRLPVVKIIYDSVKDLFKFFVSDGKQKGEVVKVPVADGKGYMLGIVMQASEGKAKEPVPVYLPMSYGMGGFLVYVPRNEVEKVDMDAGNALKLVLTAGVGTSPKDKS